MIGAFVVIQAPVGSSTDVGQGGLRVRWGPRQRG